MKAPLLFLFAAVTSSVALAAPKRDLAAEAIVVPQAQIAAIAEKPNAPLPATASHDVLNREQANGPAYLVVRIKDTSRGIAWGKLKVMIDGSPIEVSVSATLNGKSHDYFVPLTRGFYYPVEKTGSHPMVTASWKSLRFK